MAISVTITVNLNHIVFVVSFRMCNFGDMFRCYEYLKLYRMEWHWCYWQGNGLAIHRSQVCVLAGHHCVSFWARCVPLSPSSIIWYRPRG